MNLDKMTSEQKLNVARKYFYIGFAFLPFVWLVNCVWFFKEAFIKKDAPKKLRHYLLGSFVGFLIWTGVLIVWTSVYQTQRPNWGAAGDYISFNVPLGAP